MYLKIHPYIYFSGITARPPSSLRGGTASRLTANVSFNNGPPPTSQRMGTALGYAEHVN